MCFKNVFLIILLVWRSVTAFADEAVDNVHLIEERTISSIPVVNASVSIRDHNNVDVTPSFKIMLNYKTQRGLSNGNSSTNNTLHNRQRTWGRLINTCPDGQSFSESHCDPQAGVEGSLQRYSYTCRTTMRRQFAITGAGTGREGPRYHIRKGHCGDQEICVDVPVAPQYPEMVQASCIHAELFDEWQIAKDGVHRPMLDGQIFEPVMSMFAIMSQGDEKTPMEVDKFELDAWSKAEEESSTSVTKRVQRERCRDCTEIQMNAIEKGTDSLKLEARLLTGVSTATLAGVLWLTVVTAG